MKKKLVIIPAYNEEGNIVKTVSDIQANAPEFDYVIINDCSTDSTKKVCQEHHYNMVSLPCNLGIGGGVQTGYLYAMKNGYDIAVQFDGDGQHNAAYLQNMSEKLEADHLDMLIGSRFITNEGFQSSTMRRVGIKYFTGLIRMMTSKKITDPTSGMRMVNRDIIELFANNYPKDYPEPESVVTILKRGKQVEEVPVIMNERMDGVSSISPTKSVYYMIKVSIAILMASIRR